VEIHASARKHGVADEDILHAIDHALAIEEIGEDPDRWLILGPDRAVNQSLTRTFSGSPTRPNAATTSTR
jgi:hypothetical protein